MERWISAQRPLVASFDHAVNVLLEEPRSLVPEAGVQRDGAMVIDLAVDVGRGSAVRQGVEVTLGVPRSAEGEAWVPLSWTPSAHGHLLPSFDGVIEVVAKGDDAELGITGTYRVPLGVVGRFGDGIIGRRLAQQSLRALLEQMARELDDRVSEQLLHTGWHPAPYTPNLRERPAPGGR